MNFQVNNLVKNQVFEALVQSAQINAQSAFQTKKSGFCRISAEAPIAVLADNRRFMGVRDRAKNAKFRTILLIFEAVARIVARGRVREVFSFQPATTLLMALAACYRGDENPAAGSRSHFFACDGSGVLPLI